MFTLSPLPFSKEALEPHISGRTLEFHYGKHHQTYVDNLNKLITGIDLENESLENILLKTATNPNQKAIFNNAAQHYNHTFFWNSLRPAAAKMEPSAALLSLINKNFGDLEKLYAEFKAAALAQFGSGWAWLVLDNGELKIMKTANAEMPFGPNLKNLLTVDVWEHAYYLDYQNRRADFVDTVMRNLWNWDFAARNL